MNTKVCVKNEIKAEKDKLKDLKAGDWFILNDPLNGELIAIKSDETVYEGSKCICLRMNEGGQMGRLVRCNSNSDIRLIKNVEIKLK